MRYDLVHFIHTREFDECLADLPMTDEELRDVQRTLQSNPEVGDAIPGTGGVRKLRAAVKGKGKRGGARVIYFYVTTRQTVYLLLAYDKSEADDISEGGKRVLRQLAARLGVEGSAGRVWERDRSARWQALPASGLLQTTVDRWRRQAQTPTQQERAGNCGPLGTIMKKKGSIEERLIRSMGQAVEIAEGTTVPSHEYDLPLLTAKRVSVPPAPEYDAQSVIAIRTSLNLSQTVFAQALNVSPGTVRSWEQGEKPPQGPSRRLLEIAEKSPETLLGAIVVREPGESKLGERKRRGDRSIKSAGRRSGNGRRRGKQGSRRRGQV